MHIRALPYRRLACIQSGIRQLDIVVAGGKRGATLDTPRSPHSRLDVAWCFRHPMAPLSRRIAIQFGGCGPPPGPRQGDASASRSLRVSRSR